MQKIFEQYKDNKTPNLVKLGSLAQNIAGSKYMMMNITGGIANVLTGSRNGKQIMDIVYSLAK